MDVFIISTGEWQSGQSHYIVAAKDQDQAINLVREETTSFINWDSVRCVSHVLCTTITEPMIIEAIL